ncbi:MAG TPA: winged helix-turn-helix domain-containing protein [Pyrinomonadaceae bacterium]|nr:winged helix-turn-helix domain-containing protein [Pyrinomonadaceae bacterium]
MQDHLTNERSTAPEIYEFADFRLDVREHVLERVGDGERISLPAKAFDTLCVLVRNAGRLVEKDELLSTVWADSFVEENNLNKSIHAIRRALGESNGDQKFIETVKKHGFRFVAEVTSAKPRTRLADTGATSMGRMSGPGSVREFPHLVPRIADEPAIDRAPSPAAPETVSQSGADVQLLKSSKTASRGRVWLSAALTGTLLLVAVLVGVFTYRSVPAATAPAPTLAILPLKPLDASDNYLGLGVADAIIRRMSQTGKVTVRPTSSVRRYLNEEIDALTAAKQLDVDTVLEGTLQRAGDRLRVTVNLLRRSDGKSLWADNFDMTASDVFAIQDKVGRQVAASLQLRLDQAQREVLTSGYTPSAIAYEYYLKGVYNFDQRGFNIEGKPQHEATIGLFKKSIEADPNYALAHAQLAYAYAWMGVYVDETAQDRWVELAKEEIARADALDPQLAETHIARYHVLLSAHEGFQTEASTRELILAKNLNPNVGGLELAVAYNHLGLEDMFDKERERTLEIDPTSEFNKMIFGFQLIFARRYDDWLGYRQKYFDGKPNISYLMGKGRLDEAQQRFDQLPAHGWDAETSPGYGAILMALRGDRPAAEAELRVLIRKLPYKNNSYHHATYDIACVNALLGNNSEAVKWLRETAATGFPSYPLFQRDFCLDPIRQTPEFVQFMTEMKALNERVRQEFVN